MKKIAILLRKEKEVNRFRDVILKSLSASSIDSAILCSGFFQEDNRFSLGKELDVTRQRPCNRLEITTVGLYSYNWKSKYSDFVTNFKFNNCTSCLRIKKMRIPGMRWHAKIFIAKVKNDPVVAIIGSSNMTRKAFGINTDFNFESDVVIWDDSDKIVNNLVESTFESNSDLINDVIVMDYDDNHRVNRGLTLKQRVKNLEQEILGVAVEADV